MAETRTPRELETRERTARPTAWRVLDAVIAVVRSADGLRKTKRRKR